jgi:protein involved in polysaccharide export with SLBB domain
MTHMRPHPFRSAPAWAIAGILLLGGCALGRSAGDESGDPMTVAEAQRDTLAGADSVPAEVSSDYTIGPDDLLAVRVFGAPELSGESRVTSAGEISLPLLGYVEAAGLTSPEFERKVEDLLRDSYMWDPRVSVQVVEARSHAVSVVYVIGDVRRPGGFPLNRGEPISVIQALALAEGLQPTAAKGRAKIIRGGENGNEEEVPVDLERILEGTAHDPVLRHRDILYVPNSRPSTILRGAWDAFLRIFTFRGIFY